MSGVTRQDRLLAINFFSELSIVDELAFKRLTPQMPESMGDGVFGVLNRFIRNAIEEDRLSSTAWALRDSEAALREKVDKMVSRGFATLEPLDDGDQMIRLTPLAHTSHSGALDQLHPEVMPLFEGIEREALETTVAVLRELRRTLDNLPDR